MGMRSPRPYLCALNHESEDGEECEMVKCLSFFVFVLVLVLSGCSAERQIAQEKELINLRRMKDSVSIRDEKGQAVDPAILVNVGSCRVAEKTTLMHINNKQLMLVLENVKKERFVVMVDSILFPRYAAVTKDDYVLVNVENEIVALERIRGPIIRP